MAAVVGAIEDQSNDSSNNNNNNADSVKRRSRSRKPRGNRRNTIAGIDQKEIEGIENAVNGFVFTLFTYFVDYFLLVFSRDGQFLRIFLKIFFNGF